MIELADIYEKGSKFLAPRSMFHRHFLHSFNNQQKACASTVPISWMRRLRIRGSQLSSSESGFSVAVSSPDLEHLPHSLPPVITDSPRGPVQWVGNRTAIPNPRPGYDSATVWAVWGPLFPCFTKVFFALSSTRWESYSENITRDRLAEGHRKPLPVEAISFRQRLRLTVPLFICFHFQKSEVFG